jgi:hypothetical protein
VLKCILISCDEIENLMQEPFGDCTSIVKILPATLLPGDIGSVAVIQWWNFRDFNVLSNFIDFEGAGNGRMIA